MNSAEVLTIFYDGQCPLCVAEMKHLAALDKHGAIDLQDLHQSDFGEKFPNIEPAQAMAILHGYYQGQLLLGLDVTYQAWSLVGKRSWVAILRWPLLKPIADRVYLFFARHRQTISRLCAGLLPINSADCDDGKCQLASRNKSSK